jgi:hypothetical protein
LDLTAELNGQEWFEPSDHLRQSRRSRRRKDGACSTSTQAFIAEQGLAVRFAEEAEVMFRLLFV